MSEYKIKKGVPVPEDAYEVGTNPRGGKLTKYPFKDMIVGDSTEIALPSGKERAIMRGRIMAAIRSVCAKSKNKRFRVADYFDNNPESETKGTLFLRVWRERDHNNPAK